MAKPRVSLRYALELLGLKKAPEDDATVAFLLRGLEELLDRYGEEWVRQNRVRLRQELEQIDSM